MYSTVCDFLDASVCPASIGSFGKLNTKKRKKNLLLLGFLCPEVHTCGIEDHTDLKCCDKRWMSCDSDATPYSLKRLLAYSIGVNI